MFFRKISSIPAISLVLNIFIGFLQLKFARKVSNRFESNVGRGIVVDKETSFIVTLWLLNSCKFLLTLLGLCVAPVSFALAFALFLQVYAY